MDDAYRTSARACPSCGNTALREFHDRLVCDECDGMLLTTDDLARSIHEIDGSSGSVAFEDEGPSKKPCPRCQGAMTSAEVLVGHLKVYGRSLHCVRDGVWISQGALAGLFAVASRLSHAHVSGRMYGGAGKPSSAPGLAISHWGESRPRAHTLFVSAYKDRTLGCPSCKDTKLSFEGDLWSCGACNGCFVEDAALSAMVSEMSGQPWQPQSAKGGAGDRVCPVCDKPMIVEVLEAVTIDRCEGHGVYFDPDELQTALAHAAEPQHVTSWVQRLFHRHGQST
jgi:Zn-finger nucleic acid-binding protein/ribosomal protein L37AE/L43A